MDDRRDVIGRLDSSLGQSRQDVKNTKMFSESDLIPETADNEGACSDVINVTDGRIE